MKLPDYKYYTSAFKGLELPLAYVDLDLFDQNIKDILLRAGHKKIRVASKSLRCRALIERVLAADSQFQGLMCFTAVEAVWLANLGMDDLMIGYPTFQKTHLRAVGKAIKGGKTIYLMVDRPEHLERLDEIGRELDVQMIACLDMDMSSRFPGIHFGVRRSSVYTATQTRQFLEKLEACSHVVLKAAMGYEAQIAGLGDNINGKALFNRVIRLLKGRSIREIAKRRAMIVKMLKEAGHPVEVVNGGGTGSLETTKLEHCVTEVTVGSGFYSPLLFDGYQRFKHLPAAGFALEIVRQPTTNIFTCLGGGYVASGAAGVDKVPQPYLPKGCSLDKNEMAGEVQTPIVYEGKVPLAIGDMILMRHSKAGELCERFRGVHLVQNGAVKEIVPTYRGEEQCFL